MLVIAGAQYLVGDSILIPHYTGDFSIVDCDEYTILSELKGRYNKTYIKNVKDNYIENEGIKYYYAEYSPFGTDPNWELLSDLSNLRFEE